MTALQHKPVDPTAHLSAEDVERLGGELDGIRRDVLDSLGAADAAYIRTVIGVQRRLELAGRLLLLASGYRPAWVLGATALSLAKILENMEIGHNVLHGQWDWMRDPKIHSTTWEWDHASPAAQWKRAHNETHHVHTNILGKDNDLGYGIMRVDEDQAWSPRHLAQPLLNALNACVFEYGIAAYDLELGATLHGRRSFSAEQAQDLRVTLRKAARQAAKDYLLFPLLSGPWFLHTLTADLTANLVRNVWSHSVIMCGHFPEGVETFEQTEVDARETRGQWYLRQMLGSADVSGSPLLHVLMGNLSHQIEHHLFPDLPSNRYAEVAVRVREVFARHDLTYHVAPLPQQLASAWHKVLRLSLPNGWLARGRSRVGSVASTLRPQRRRVPDAARAAAAA